MGLLADGSLRSAIGRLSGALLLSGSAVLAQQPNGTVVGVVHDAGGMPIAAVEVSVAIVGARTRSDSAGRFVFTALPSGEAMLYFRHLAYAPDTATIDVAPHDTTNIDVTLSVVAQRLSAVVIEETPQHRRALREFEERRKAGFGRFITRADIERRKPLQMSDMFRLIPGAVLLGGPGGTARLRFNRSIASRDCPPQYWIDGQPVDRLFNVDDVAPSDIEGVEIYAGPSVTPPQFNGINTNAACGTIVIWTRVP